MRNLSSFQVMLKKYRLGKRSMAHYQPREKGKSEGDYVLRCGWQVRHDEIRCSIQHTYIKKTVRNFDAVLLLVDIFKAGTLVYNTYSTEIKPMLVRI